MSKVLCKPMLLDCLYCKKSKDGQVINGSHFCFDKEKCSVPFAIIENGKILAWADE